MVQKREKIRIALSFSLLFFSLASASLAEEPAEVRLEDLLQRAREANPDLIAAKADWLAAKKRIWIDSSLPDPVGGYDLMGSMTETRVGPQKNRFTVSQEVPFPLKLVEKGKAANDEAHAAYQRYLAVERDLKNELAKFHAELYFVDASLQSLQGIKDLLKKFESVAQARYSNLSGSQRDVAKAEAEVSMSLEKLFVLKQRRESIAALINSILDRDPMDLLGLAVRPEKPVLKQSLVELVNLAVLKRQEINEMEALVSKSAHEKHLAKLAYIPDLNVSFEYVQVGSGSTTEPSDVDGRDSWMFPLRINFPLGRTESSPRFRRPRKNSKPNKPGLSKPRTRPFTR